MERIGPGPAAVATPEPRRPPRRVRARAPGRRSAAPSRRLMPGGRRPEGGGEDALSRLSRDAGRVAEMAVRRDRVPVSGDSRSGATEALRDRPRPRPLQAGRDDPAGPSDGPTTPASGPSSAPAGHRRRDSRFRRAPRAGFRPGRGAVERVPPGSARARLRLCAFEDRAGARKFARRVLRPRPPARSPDSEFLRRRGPPHALAEGRLRVASKARNRSRRSQCAGQALARIARPARKRLKRPASDEGLEPSTRRSMVRAVRISPQSSAFRRFQ